MTSNIYNKKYTKPIVLLMIILLMFIWADVSEGYVFAQKMAKKQSFPNENKMKNEPPVTLGSAACLIDAKTGYMIYGVDEHEKNYPASTTKILTGLLAMENLNIDDEVTAGIESEKQGGSQIYLSEGEKMSVNNLMYGMMLPSANDAAMALGEAMAGNVQNFAKMMNDKAKNIGAVNSNFVNPNGLPDDNHYTTAYDLALITKEAMKNDNFRRYVSTYEYTIPKTNSSGKRLVHNRNRLLYNVNRKIKAYGETKSIKYDGVTGVKTGFTNKAEFCLVGSAERNGTELIAVTLKSKDMNGYQDVISMLDYGFNNYKTVEVMAKGQAVDDLKVNGGAEKYGKAQVVEGLYVTLPIDADEKDIKTEKKYKDLKAPYNSNVDGGTIEAYYKDAKVGEAEVTLTQGMEEGSAFDDILTGSGFMGVLSKILIAVAIIIIAILVLRAINKGRRRARRRRRRREYK